MLVSTEQIKESVNRYKAAEAITAKDETVQLTEAVMDEHIDGRIPNRVKKGNITGSQENLVDRLKLIEAKAPEPAAFAFERAIGKNDSVYSNFVELIATNKKKVARIVIRNAGRTIGYATGFMVSERLLLTNWHVFNEQAEVGDSEVQFYYEYDLYGRPVQPVSFKLAAKDFFFSYKPLDYCLVAVETMDVSGTVQLNSFGYIFLDPASGKLGDEDVEYLNIIHHPGGDFKQLSIRENKFTKIMPTTLWYESDTAQGSSGSPVFNDQWQIVALHHMGVPDMSPDGKNYLDIDGNIIPLVNGKVDEAKIHWIANEGIRISVILKDVFNRFPGSDFIDAIKKQPDAAVQQETGETEEGKTDKPTKHMDSNQDVRVAFPASLLNESGQVTFSISNRAGGKPQVEAVDKETAVFLDANAEIKKVDKENGVDFTDCKGYQPKFMPVNIPMPAPKKTLAKQLAKMSNGKTELKYFKYSVLFNAVTKMPALSAINVEGNPELRLDNSKRSDDWLRDKRIPIENQLTDKFYAKSGFDKGHMSRFEDANWDKTEALAFRNGIYTCFYTNACPQVPGLNRGGGVWGKLEKAVLEKGVKKEEGKLGRITVFNGPIFSEAKNRKFRGETIPMEFFKIIVWVNDDDDIKATAFKLSQEDLVQGIQFTEAAGLQLEAIDIDSDAAFKEYQCSIASITTATGINFSGLNKYDTFDKNNPNEAMQIEGEEELERLILKNGGKGK